MTRVVLMCGPAGSGKSTVARRFEDQGLVRLSVDDEAWRRGLRSQPLSEADAREIDDHLRARLLQLVAAGTDVVLDYSNWSRAARDEFRSLLRPFGIEPETVYVRTPREVALERVRIRRGEHPDAVHLSAEVAGAYYDAFEAPTPDEGPLTVVTGTGEDAGVVGASEE